MVVTSQVVLYVPLVDIVATDVLLLVHVNSSVNVKLSGLIDAVIVVFSPGFKVILFWFNAISVIDVLTTTVHSAVFPFSVDAVMVAVPFDIPVISPVWSTVTIFVSLLVHVILFCTFASWGSIVATNFSSLVPLKSNIVLVLFRAIPVGDVCTVISHESVLSFEVVTVIVAVPFPTPVWLLLIFLLYLLFLMKELSLVVIWILNILHLLLKQWHHLV